MKAKRISELLFSLLFLLLLSAAALATLRQPRSESSFFENRRLAALPELTADALRSGESFGALDDWCADHAALREPLLKLRTAAQLFFNKEILGCPVVNDVVVLDDLLLRFIPYEVLKPDVITERAEELAENLCSVRDVTEACGGQFLYVTLPCQYVSFAASYPAWLNNRAAFTELSRGTLLTELERRGVDCLDLGPLLLDPGTRDRSASRTDNHFTMHGAFLTCRAILRHINESREEPLTLLEPGEYTLSRLPNPYLGSRSRKLFALDGVREQLGILLPLQPVPFRRWTNGAEVEPVVYDLPKTAYEPVDYNLYMGGDLGETVIQTGREELPSVLIYGDSFTNAVECVLYYSFGRMHSLDLRYYREQSLADYIKTYRPDYVICLRDYEQSANPEGNGIHARTLPHAGGDPAYEGCIGEAAGYENSQSSSSGYAAGSISGLTRSP